MKTGGLRKWDTFQPTTLAIQKGEDVAHPFGLGEGSHDVHVDVIEATVRYFKNPWMRYVFLFGFDSLTGVT